MKKIFSSIAVLGLLVSIANADVFSNKDCNDPVKINALKTYYKDFEKNEARPAPKFEGVTFKIKNDVLPPYYIKYLKVKKEDGYICEAGGSGVGRSYRVIKLDGKVYIYDNNYDFGKYSLNPDSVEFIKKYGVILK